MAVKAKSSKKPQSERRKSARASSRQRGEERKAQRRKLDAERARANQSRRALGQPTLAELAYMERRERRETLAVIARNPCNKAGCRRFNGHKGKHGQPTQTELNDARSMARMLRDRNRGTRGNMTPRRVTWESSTRRMLRANRSK